MDRLSLRGLRVDCIVGIYPSERQIPQPIDLDVSLHLDLRHAARDSRFRETVDYARLAGELRFLLQASRFLLLESAAEAIAAWILSPPSADVPRPQVQAVDLRIAKPQALAGAALPELQVHREPSDFQFSVEDHPYGWVDVIFEARECGVYRDRLRPGASILTHRHEHTDEAELVLGEGLLLQGRPAPAGVARHWPRGFAHRYDNPTDQELSILRVDRPRLQASDMVPAELASSAQSDVEPTRFFRA